MPIPDVSDLDQTVSTFIYSMARNRKDRQAGRICTNTGMWAPGHMIVYVDGQPYIRGEQPLCSQTTQASIIAEFRRNLKSPV